MIRKKNVGLELEPVYPCEDGKPPKLEFVLTARVSGDDLSEVVRTLIGTVRAMCPEAGPSLVESLAREMFGAGEKLASAGMETARTIRKDVLGG